MGTEIGDFPVPPKIRAWYDNVGRGSRITSDVYARSLRLFCYRTKTTPDSLLHHLPDDSAHAAWLLLVQILARAEKPISREGMARWFTDLDSA